MFHSGCFSKPGNNKGDSNEIKQSQSRDLLDHVEKKEQKWIGQ